MLGYQLRMATAHAVNDGPVTLTHAHFERRPRSMPDVVCVFSHSLFVAPVVDCEQIK